MSTRRATGSKGKPRGGESASFLPVKSKDSGHGSSGLPKRKEAGPLTASDVRDEALEILGITQGGLGAKSIKKAVDLMDATKLKVVAHEGKITDQIELEDNATQLGAARLVAEMAPVFSSRSEGGKGETNVQINVVLPSWYTPKDNQ